LPLFGPAVKENLARKQIICRSAPHGPGRQPRQVRMTKTCAIAETFLSSTEANGQLPRDGNRATLAGLSESYRDAR
jgi:hypothetical protein